MLGSIADYGDLELSPDGKRLAVAVLDAAEGTRDIWLYEVSTGRRTVFTSNSADENWSLWAPDGRHVVFNSEKSGHLDLYQASSTESGGHKDEVLLADEAPKWPVSWSSDGKYILYVIDHPQTGNDIWVLPLSSGRPSERQEPFPYIQSQFAENWAAFSPDGHWVVYSSTESPSGRPEVYIASFPTPDRRWKDPVERRKPSPLAPRRARVVLRGSRSHADGSVSQCEGLQHRGKLCASAIRAALSVRPVSRLRRRARWPAVSRQRTHPAGWKAGCG